MEGPESLVHLLRNLAGHHCHYFSAVPTGGLALTEQICLKFFPPPCHPERRSNDPPRRRVRASRRTPTTFLSPIPCKGILTKLQRHECKLVKGAGLRCKFFCF